MSNGSSVVVENTLNEREVEVIVRERQMVRIRDLEHDGRSSFRDSHTAIAPSAASTPVSRFGLPWSQN